MDLRINIWLFFCDNCTCFFVGILESTAQLTEILAGLWTVLIEQLNNNFLWLSQSLQLKWHMDVATAWCLINCQAMGVTRCFPVYQNTRFICVTEVTESPLKEIFDISNILGAVENYQMAGFVLIKQALQLSLCFCKILIPLCWEEL